MKAKPFVVLAAGGTGGHLFPAEALAHALAGLGVEVELATDARAVQYAQGFPARAVHGLPSASPFGASILSKGLAAFALFRGTLRARALMRRARPAAVVGFGGYPSVPAVMAGAMLGVPTIIHEQNAVMGRANGFLAPRVGAIATGFSSVRGVAGGPIAAKATHVGNPVRAAVIEAAGTPFPPLGEGDKLRVLVFGGSQGARVMSEIAPVAVGMLPDAVRGRLALVQQARAEDAVRVREVYAALGVEAVVEPFFADLPARMAASHLVVGRSGAGTVAELACIGRPSILVPLPGALDQDQAANAASLGDIGAATVIAQADFTPERLANAIVMAATDPVALTRAAAAAKSAGTPDAAERLAGLVLRVAHITP